MNSKHTAELFLFAMMLVAILAFAACSSDDDTNDDNNTPAEDGDTSDTQENTIDADGDGDEEASENAPLSCENVAADSLCFIVEEGDFEGRYQYGLHEIYPSGCIESGGRYSVDMYDPAEENNVFKVLVNDYTEPGTFNDTARLSLVWEHVEEGEETPISYRSVPHCEITIDEGGLTGAFECLLQKWMDAEDTTNFHIHGQWACQGE